MAIVAGIGIDVATSRLKGWQSYLPVLAALALLVISAFVAWDITYVKYASGDVLLVYVSGTDGYTDLVNRVENESLRFNGMNTTISVISTDYWPLPWSLRDYKHAAWNGRSIPNQDAPLIISSKSDFSEIKAELRGQYYTPQRYEIRQGVYVWLYVKK